MNNVGTSPVMALRGTYKYMSAYTDNAENYVQACRGCPLLARYSDSIPPSPQTLNAAMQTGIYGLSLLMQSINRDNGL